MFGGISRILRNGADTNLILEDGVDIFASGAYQMGNNKAIIAIAGTSSLFIPAVDGKNVLAAIFIGNDGILNLESNLHLRDGVGLDLTGNFNIG